MPITVNVNGLSLCHKKSDGVVRATLPDVCKTPPNGIPVPYPNIAYSKDLAKGTKTVRADGGAKCANRASNFKRSIGDEPGTMGGIKSGVNRSKATWLSWSPNVFLEGKPACRLTDKMLLNNGNTVSVGGEHQAWLGEENRELTDELCDWMCECMNVPGAGARTACLEAKIRDKYYFDDNGRRYPKDDSRLWTEVHMTSTGGDPWSVVESTTHPGKPTSNPWPIAGSIRPDLFVLDGAGTIESIVEVKFPSDSIGPNQGPGGAYADAADDLGADYQVMWVEDECDCDDDEDEEEKSRRPPFIVPLPDKVEEDESSDDDIDSRWPDFVPDFDDIPSIDIPTEIIVGGAIGLGVAACFALGPCTLGSAAAGIAALGIIGFGIFGFGGTKPAEAQEPEEEKPHIPHPPWA